MQRREFIALVGSVAATRPQWAAAQQPDRMRRVGVLMGIAESDPVAATDDGRALRSSKSMITS